MVRFLRNGENFKPGEVGCCQQINGYGEHKSLNELGDCNVEEELQTHTPSVPKARIGVSGCTVYSPGLSDGAGRCRAAQ